MTSCRPSHRASLPSLGGTSVGTRSFRSVADEHPPPRPEVGDPVAPAGNLPRRRQNLPSWFPATTTLVYSTAGQHPPLVFRGGNVLNPGETAGGLPLGAAADEQYEERLQPLSPGDRLFFFTDGIIDELRERQAGGTTTERLAQQLRGAADEPLQHQVQSIVEGLSENLFDDLLLVGCEVIAPAAGKPGDLELIE